MQYWNLPVQWSDAFTVTTSFKTEIISSENGTEQRRAKRGAPRRSFDFRLLAIGDVLTKFQFFMSSAQRDIVVMPEAVRYVRTTGPLVPGDNTIPVAEVPPWMTAGGFIALIVGPRVRVHQIAGIVGNVLSLTEQIDQKWRAGIKVAAAWKGLLADSLSFDLATNQALQGGVSFMALPGFDKFVQTEADITQTFDGREMFPFANNWISSPTVTYQQDRKLVDYDKGVIEMFAPVPFGNRIYTNDVLCRTPDDTQRLTEFFGRMLGRQGEFFFRPLARAPMRMAADYVQDSTTMLLAGDEPRRVFTTDTTLRVLEISRRGKLPNYRVVNSVVADGDNSRVTFDLGLPEIISADDPNVTVSWIALARFESDDLTVDWKTDQAATSRLTVRTLAYAPSEDMSELDEGAQWLLNYFGAAFAIKYILDPLLTVVNTKEPRFALIVDEGTQYLIDRFGRDTADRYVLNGVNYVLNYSEPRFAEA